MFPDRDRTERTNKYKRVFFRHPPKSLKGVFTGSPVVSETTEKKPNLKPGSQSFGKISLLAVLSKLS